MSVQTEVAICSNPDCSWNEDNKCINGLNPPQECPTRSLDSTSKPLPQNNKSDDIHEPIEKDIIKLEWGDTFTDDNLHLLTYRYPFQLVLVVGEPSSGKSTLYAAVFDSFQKGTCGNYAFHSSRTPIGFEKTCHLAREKSGNRVPKTERTKLYEFSYFHLSMREIAGSSSPVHLVFADVNGERYQHARESDDEMLRLTVFSKADHIFFVADGALLINSATRHTVKDDVTKIIARAIQNNMISNDQQMHLVITKWDEIVSAGAADTIQSFLITPMQSRFPDIQRVLRIASRTMNDAVPARSGISDFLSACAVPRRQVATPTLPNHTRQFQKFKYSTHER